MFSQLLNIFFHWNIDSTKLRCTSYSSTCWLDTIILFSPRFRFILVWAYFLFFPCIICLGLLKQGDISCHTANQLCRLHCGKILQQRANTYSYFGNSSHAIWKKKCTQAMHMKDVEMMLLTAALPRRAVFPLIQLVSTHSFNKYIFNMYRHQKRNYVCVKPPCGGHHWTFQWHWRGSSMSSLFLHQTHPL